MRKTDRIVMELAHEQRDLVSRLQLRHNGISRQATQRLEERGILDEVFPSIWRVGKGALTFEQRMVACCLATPGGVLSHATAAAEYSLRKAPRDRLEITIGYNDKIRVPDVLVHRSNRIDPEDIVHRLDGSRIVTPERAAFDLASVLDYPALLSLMLDGIKQEVTSAEALAEVASRLATSGRQGSAQYRRAVAAIGGKIAPVESHGELVLFRALEAAGLDPQPQYWVRLLTGASVRMDLAFPEVLLDLEYDPAFTHASPIKVQADKCRDIQVARVGFTTHRVTDIEVSSQLRSTVALICELYHQAAARYRPAA